MDPKRPTPRHIIIKMARPKDKKRFLKATKEKQVVTYKGAPIYLSSDFKQKHIKPGGSGMKFSR